MTTEEKAKAYDEAIERAKKFHTPDSNNSNLKAVLELIFPKLAESEDERIRRAIVLGVRRCADAGSIFGTIISNEGVNYSEVLAWLERQKDLFRGSTEMVEQKPAKWSEENEKMRSNLMSLLANMRGDRITEETYQKYYPWLKSLRPQPNTVSIKDATKFGNLEYERGVKDGIQHVKNHHWKPSKEQMEAFKQSIEWDDQRADDFDKTLQSLYNDLKKLL